MIKEIIGNFAQIAMSNGAILEGFVHGGNETHIKLVEYNNNKVIINIEDISFARIKSESENNQPQESSNDVCIGAVVSTPRSEFSMQTPQKSDLNTSNYKAPEFVRTTNKEK